MAAPIIPTASQKNKYLQIGTATDGYWLDDNPWGAAGLVEGPGADQYMQEVGRHNVLGPQGQIAWRAKWRWPQGTTEVKGFPCVMQGAKPGNYSPDNYVAGFPVILPDGSTSQSAPSGWTPGAYTPMQLPVPPIVTNYKFQHNEIATGQGQLTWDIWLQSEPGLTTGFKNSSITHEIMIPVSNWGGYGTYPDNRNATWYDHDATIDGRLFHVYCTKEPNGALLFNFQQLNGVFGRYGWKMIVFQPDVTPLVGPLNLSAFINYLATRTDSLGNKWATGTEYLADMELGIETIVGAGDVTVYDMKTSQGVAPPPTAPQSVFDGSVDGFWLDAYPLNQFQQSSTVTTSPPAYGTPGASTGAEFGRWLDKSGNARDALREDAQKGFAEQIGAFYAAYIYTPLSVAVCGGSTTAFYYCWTGKVISYYGTIFSDVAAPNTGFRLQHSADNDSVAGPGDVRFSAGIGTGRVEIAATADLLPAYTAWDAEHTIEAWFDGATLFLRVDNGTLSSAPCSGVVAGSTTVYLGAVDNLATPTDSGEFNFYHAVYTKNKLPTATQRAEIFQLSNSKAGLAPFPVTSESQQDYVAFVFASKDGPQTYTAFVADGAVANERAQTYAAFLGLAAEKLQNYGAETGIAAESAQSYTAIAGPGSVAAEFVQNYHASEVVFAEISQGYAAFIDAITVYAELMQTFAASGAGTGVTNAITQTYQAFGDAFAELLQTYDAVAPVLPRGSVSPAQQVAFEKAVVPWAFFVEMQFVSGTQRLCNFNQNFDWGGFTWNSLGGAGSIGEIRSTEKVEPAPVTLSLSVAQAEWLALSVGAVEDYRGRTVKIYQCPLTEQYQLIDTPMLAWEGDMDLIAISVEGEAGSVTMRCEPAAKRLRRRNALRVNAQQQRQRYPYDAGFDFQAQLLASPVTWLSTTFQRQP